jgi:hypothetical protein
MSRAVHQCRRSRPWLLDGYFTSHDPAVAVPVPKDDKEG